jgi:hypothetical protein
VSSWKIRSLQPGNPGSSTIESGTVVLFAPGSDQYAAAKAIYDRLQRYQRVEAYVGTSPEGIGLGQLQSAGIITEIRKGTGPNAAFELTIEPDLGLLSRSQPFPGEKISVNYGALGNASVRQARNFMAMNEVGPSDDFSAFDPTAYTSTGLPALTAGAWSSTADDGRPAVSTTTGTGAVLLSKAGARAQDNRHSQFVEASGRIFPAANDPTNSGKYGVGLSLSSADVQTCIVAYVVVRYNSTTGKHDVDLIVDNYAFGTKFNLLTVANALTSLEDSDGLVPITISLLSLNEVGSAVVVNGTAFSLGNQIWDTSTVVTMYPFLMFGTPASGAATSYVASLVQLVRYSDDLNTGTAAFKLGTAGAPAHSIPDQSDAGPSFLEVLARVATRESWFMRYTPQAYIPGLRTLGTIDLSADPGTDRSSGVILSRSDGTLLALELVDNADAAVASTTAAGPAGAGGGGIAYARSISAMKTYGAIGDQLFSLAAPNFSEQRTAARVVVARKITTDLSGSKTATASAAGWMLGRWRELDRVLIDEPELGIIKQVARILAITFGEGSPFVTIVLDQFSADDHTVLQRRAQQALLQIAAKFAIRP